jgi:hypothetical protein
MNETIEVTDLGIAESHHPLVLAQRLRAYRSKRLLLRSHVRIAGLAFNVAAALVRERSETWGDRSSYAAWVDQTTRLAIEHELAGGELDIDGESFDPDGSHWRAFLVRIGVTPQSHPGLFGEDDR